VYVTIHAPIALARDLRLKKPLLAPSRELYQILAEFGLELKALHPNSSDPTLASQFYVLAGDSQVAARIQEQIEEAGIVEAVYVKPPEGPPSA
jgi:hypothetical protein